MRDKSGIAFELELRFFNLERILQNEGRDAAVPYMEKLNADCVEHLGRDHSTSTNVRASLAALYLQTQNIERARQSALDDLKMFDEIGDEDNPSAASALNTLAVLAVRQGDFEEAEKRHRDALRRRISSQGEGHSDTVAQKSNLAATVWRQGRHKEATDLLQEVIDARLQLLGPQDTRTLEATYQTLRMLLVMKAHKQGEKLADRILGPQLSTRPATGQWASLLTAWAELKIHQQDFDRAHELLNSARSVFEENPSASNPSRTKAVDAAEEQLTKTKPAA